MKTSTVGLVLAAILMAVAGVGFGIAQAGGNHSEGPVLSFEDQESLGQSSSSNQYSENRPVFTFEDEVQLRNPIGTGNLPAESNAGPSEVKIEGRTYTERAWKGDIDGH